MPIKVGTLSFFDLRRLETPQVVSMLHDQATALHSIVLLDQLVTVQSYTPNVSSHTNRLQYGGLQTP